jgi:hypothetical protein
MCIYNFAITNRELQNSLWKPRNPILQKLSCCELLALEARKKGKKAKKESIHSKAKKGNLEERKNPYIPWGESLGSSSRNSGVGKAIGGFASVAETMVDLLRFSPGFVSRW